MDPPEEAYGRVTNPQRFAPLVPAAAALTADLERRFDVSVTRGPAKQSNSTTVIPLETIRIRPVRLDEAPLTVTVTSFPGLYLDFGAWHHFSLPSCGCDACDEDAEDGLRHLARYVEALTSRQLSERITGTIQPMLEHSRKAKDWVSSGRGPIDEHRTRRLRLPRRTLDSSTIRTGSHTPSRLCLAPSHTTGQSSPSTLEISVRECGKLEYPCRPTTRMSSAAVEV